MRYSICLFLIVAFFIACSTTSDLKSPRGSRNTITAEEITSSSANTAYEAIQLLRPNLLHRDRRRSIDTYTSAQVVVYVNNVRYGGKESLERIPADNILVIHYLSPSEATTKFGASGGGGGAFMITLK